MAEGTNLIGGLAAVQLSEQEVESLAARLTAQFTERSASEHTRRAYRRVVREFLQFLNVRHAAEVTSSDILRWRDCLAARRQRAATIAFKLSVVRSLFDHLRAAGLVGSNPAAAKLVPPPTPANELRGRVLAAKEVRRLLAAPNRVVPEGARDYALLLVMLRTSLRVAEACALRVSDVRWSHGRWVLRFKAGGRSERTVPLPKEVKQAIDDYLKLDRPRREKLRCGGLEAFLFQPHVNYRTLEFNKPLSTTMAWYLVRKWGEYAGLGKLSPHDLRRTAITKALDQGLSYRQVQMMSGHRDPKTVMRYDSSRESLELSAINFLRYDEDELPTNAGEGSLPEVESPSQP